MGCMLRVRYVRQEEPHKIIDFSVISREMTYVRKTEEDEILVNTETLPDDFFRKWMEYEVIDGKLEWSSLLHDKNK